MPLCFWAFVCKQLILCMVCYFRFFLLLTCWYVVCWGLRIIMSACSIHQLYGFIYLFIVSYL